MSWIKGKEILEREGWGLYAELGKAYKKGLHPYRDLDQAILTPRIIEDGKVVDNGSRCFHCVHGSEERGYMATGCPRNDANQADDTIIQLMKSRVEGLRGWVLKELFPEGFPNGFPATLFDNLVCRADADFVKFVEEQENVGPDNLQAMLIESYCSRQKVASPAEMRKRLLAANFRLSDVEAYEKGSSLLKPETAPPAPDQDQQVEKPREDFTGPRDHAKYLLKENPSKGLAMLKIEVRWKLKKYEAAAYVLDRQLPGDEDERRRLNDTYRYHVGLLDKGK